MQAETVLKALADGSRLKIVAYLSSGPKFVEQIARQFDISVSTASFHLEKLKAAGLVCDKKEQYYKSYSLVKGAFDIKLSDLIGEGKDDGVFEKETVKEYFDGERLIKLPVQKMKRAAVLGEISKRLLKKGGYSERELNVELAGVYEDFIFIRKELLSSGLMEIKDGRYKIIKKNNNKNI